MNGDSDSALSGIRVLDLTEERGLYAGKMLADFGADVVKVESPDGCDARRIGPFKDDVPGVEKSLYFINFNTGKRGITLDISSTGGRSILEQLVKGSDVVILDMEPAAMRNMKLDYQSLNEINRRIILAAITGFGQDGPYSEYKAPDLVSFAMGGLMYVSGQPDRAPVTAPCEQSYYGSSIIAAFGIIAALYLRLSTGQGQFIDVSAEETMASFNQRMMNYSVASEMGKRMGSQYNAAPARIYPCKDGYVHIMVLRAAHWLTFLELMGNPKELTGKNMYDAGFRTKYAGLIDSMVTDFTMAHTKDEITGMCQEKKIPCTPVSTPADFSSDIHEMERGFITQLDHPAIGRHSYLGPPCSLSATPCRTGRPSPQLGEHNKEIYCDELGYTHDELTELETEGII